MDLTKVDGCYCKELRQNCPMIKFMLEEPLVTVEEMKFNVQAIVAVARINATAKKRFLTNLEACTTKEEIDKLCYNSVMAGKWYKPENKPVMA